MDPTPVALPWSDILKVTLGSGVVSAAITAGLNWYLDLRKVRAAAVRDARYLALRLAVILERFAIDCADAIGDIQLHIDSSGVGGKDHSKLPELAEYPLDADWKALEPALSNRALSLPTEIVVARRAISFEWDVTGEHDEVVRAVLHKAGSVGFRAWQLASDLRDGYDIPPPDFLAGKDLAAILREYHEKDAAELTRPVQVLGASPDARVP